MSDDERAAAVDDTTVRERLRDVYWIGGGSGAGKSTIAGRIAERHGMDVYSTDAVMGNHAGRLTPQEAPQLARFAEMDMDERWANRSPEDMLETFHWFQGEGFRLIVEDLLALPDRPVVVEGFRLLPSLVEPLLVDRNRAVWLLPTSDFRWAAFQSRGTAWDIPNRTGDPERALRNLLERDRMFTDRLTAETDRLDLCTIRVDQGIGEDELVERVAKLFGL